MVIKINKMDAITNSINNVNSENINIIKKIINDFENVDSNTEQKAKQQQQQHQRQRRKHYCKYYGKISHSDSFIHRYKRSQISPKASSLENNFIKFKPTKSLQEFLETDDDIYINFIDNCDNNADYFGGGGGGDANTAFSRRCSRINKSKKSLLGNNIKYSDGIDEVNAYMDSKKHQEQVNKNVKEVRICKFQIASTKFKRISLAIELLDIQLN